MEAHTHHVVLFLLAAVTVSAVAQSPTVEEGTKRGVVALVSTAVAIALIVALTSWLICLRERRANADNDNNGSSSSVVPTRTTTTTTVAAV